MRPPVVAAALPALLALPPPALRPARAQEMSLDTIERGLDATPPLSWAGAAAARQPYIENMDAWAARPDAVYWDCFANESNPALLSYYLHRMDRTLDEVNSTVVTTGARFWKLYSSGVIAKTPAGVYSVDVVQGQWKDVNHPDGDPAGNTGGEGTCTGPRSLPKAQGGYFSFYWPDEMQARYAALVDVHLTSHIHGDHTNYALIDRLVGRGKEVVVSDDTWGEWARTRPTIAARVRRIPPDADVRVAGFTVRRLGGPGPGLPLVEAMKSPGGGAWNCSNSSDVERVFANGSFTYSGPDPMMNVYLVRAAAAGAGGVTLLHNGDNRCRDFVRPGLTAAVAAGWRPTLFARTRPWPPSPRLELELWQLLPDLVIYPGHNYEFGHKGGHPPVPTHQEYISGYFTSAEIGPQMHAGRFLTWTWGEAVSFPGNTSARRGGARA